MALSPEPARELKSTAWRMQVKADQSRRDHLRVEALRAAVAKGNSPTVEELTAVADKLFEWLNRD
jgi:anti-sigma28 factor (negative regulator of flagellin synthesis)